VGCAVHQWAVLPTVRRRCHAVDEAQKTIESDSEAVWKLESSCHTLRRKLRDLPATATCVVCGTEHKCSG
jgi:hypothetical protein